MLAERELDLETLVLSSGSHDVELQEGFCIMEAVAYIAGLPWSDRPSCSCPVISDLLRAWNDMLDHEERQELKRYIHRLIETNDPTKVATRSWILVNWALREHLPLALDAIDEQEARRCAAGLRGLNVINAESARMELKRAILFLDAARTLDFAGFALYLTLDRAISLIRAYTRTIYRAHYRAHIIDLDHTLTSGHWQGSRLALMDSRHQVIERLLAA